MQSGIGNGAQFPPPLPHAKKYDKAHSWGGLGSPVAPLCSSSVSAGQPRQPSPSPRRRPPCTPPPALPMPADCESAHTLSTSSICRQPACASHLEQNWPRGCCSRMGTQSWLRLPCVLQRIELLRVDRHRLPPPGVLARFNRRGAVVAAHQRFHTGCVGLWSAQSR